MAFKLKTRLTLVITTLVTVVLAIVSAFALIAIAQELIQVTYDNGALMTRQIYAQVRQALATAAPPTDSTEPLTDPSTFLRDAFAQNAGLTTLLESTSGNAPTILYLAVTDSQNVILAHSNRSLVGQRLGPVEDLNQLMHASPWTQLRIIYGKAKTFEVTFPLVDANKKLLATVRAAMSTALIEKELDQFLRKSFLIASVALLVALVLSGSFSNLLLAPLAFISAGIERMIRGEFGQPIQLRRQDEFGQVSDRLNEIGQRLEVNREQIDALKGNIGQIIQSLDEKFLFINPRLEIMLISPSAAFLLGLEPESSIAKPLPALLPAGHPLMDLIGAAFGVRSRFTQASLELPATHKIINAKVQLIEEKGKSMGALILLHDPETVAKLETQLEYAKKLAALSRVTSGVAHEVKNPLNAIVIHLELLKTRMGKAPPATEKSLSIITQEIKRLDRVVRSFLDFTKPIELQILDVQIDTLLADVVTLASTEAAQSNVEIRLDMPEDLPTIRIDPDLIKQCLLNVMLNGVQAMPEGGVLTVEAVAGRRLLEISVQDTGLGIAPENREKIFNLYYTTKEHGNGIGLAMVFKIVQLHNGDISVESEVGKGSRFVLKLPLN